MASIIEKENTECLIDIWNGIAEERQKEAAFWDYRKNQATFWDKRADGYTRNVSSDGKDRNVAAILELLETAGFKPEGSSVLDIGSGPGTLALPLARLGARVVALDVSENMLKNLGERSAREGLKSIETIHASWQDVDLEMQPFKEKFDLVVASMTPAMSDANAFMRMMGVSRGLCYYSGFIKRTWDTAYYELYRALFNEEYKDRAMGFQIPFMYLYSMGYRPNIKLNKDTWVVDETVDETVETIGTFFSQSKEMSPDMKETIKKYLTERAHNGSYHAETNVFTGMMAWKVDSI